MGICVNCAHKGTCTLVSYYETQGEHVVKCGKRKPITNADRIRAMTDKELAEWLSCNCTGDGYGNSAEDWLDWLRQEATDADNKAHANTDL